jgi:hypothetical protein
MDTIQHDIKYDYKSVAVISINRSIKNINGSLIFAINRPKQE